MHLNQSDIDKHNGPLVGRHKKGLDHARNEMPGADAIVKKLSKFQVAIPSWALGTGGSRFGRFALGGEPRSLEEKIEDVGTLHALNKSSGAIEQLRDLLR